jgi:hypothetical protein
MWQKIDARQSCTRQRARRRISGDEGAAGAAPHTTRNADGSRPALDALDDIEWRHESAFLPIAVTLDHDGEDGQDLTAFIAADVDDSPASAADADKIGLRDLQRASIVCFAAFARSEMLVIWKPNVLRSRTNDGSVRSNGNANPIKGYDPFYREVRIELKRRRNVASD